MTTHHTTHWRMREEANRRARKVFFFLILSHLFISTVSALSSNNSVTTFRHHTQQPIIVAQIRTILAQLRYTQRYPPLCSKMSGIFENELLDCQMVLNKRLHIWLFVFIFTAVGLRAVLVPRQNSTQIFNERIVIKRPFINAKWWYSNNSSHEPCLQIVRANKSYRQ